MKILKTILLICFGMLACPLFLSGQEINKKGWPLPDLRGLLPYSIVMNSVDGVEKVVEKFYTKDGGHVARISANDHVFAYEVDHDQEPPIDYFLIDPDGSGKFTQKFKPGDSYKIPEWVSY